MARARYTGRLCGPTLRAIIRLQDGKNWSKANSEGRPSLSREYDRTDSNAASEFCTRENDSSCSGTTRHATLSTCRSRPANSKIFIPRLILLKKRGVVCADAGDGPSAEHVGNLERFGMQADNINRRKPSSLATPGTVHIR